MQLYKDKTKILFITHYYFRAEGGGDTDERIVNYLKNKAKKVVLITNPFPESDSNISYCFIYEHGVKIKELKVFGFKGGALLTFSYQILIIYFLLFKVGLNYDFCIAANNFSFIVLFPLRSIKVIKKLIFYSIDFVPKRFPNFFLDWLYHLLYRLACKFSDTNWVMTKEQIEANKSLNITSTNSSSFCIVPIGYDTKRIKIRPVKDINYYNIVYMGGLRESHGPQLAIEAMPILLKSLPNIYLTVIGGGKYEIYLKSLARKLKVEKRIDFVGYVKNFNDLTEILVTKSIGLATYKPLHGSLSFYSDPSKIKLYMVCGLPVITTNVTTMAAMLSKTKSGVVIDYSEKNLANSVIYLLKNERRYVLFRQAAIRQSSDFNIGHILDTAVKRIPN